jgi:hypothetical protein
MLDSLHIFLIILAIVLTAGIVYTKTKYDKVLHGIFEQNALLQKKLNNKIADLDPVALDTYLESIMLIQLRIEAATNSTMSDPNASEDLYARGLVAFTNYLGNTANILCERYGQSFLKNWYDMRFKMMNMTGEITRIIQNPPYSQAYQEEVHRQNELNILMQLQNGRKPTEK